MANNKYKPSDVLDVLVEKSESHVYLALLIQGGREQCEAVTKN